MSDVLTPLTIPPRFRGPSSSGNGGWTAGSLASYLPAGPVRVMLRKPPPLETALRVESDDDGGVRAFQDDILVAEATPATGDLAPSEPVAPVDVATARAAEAAYAGLRSHPFPSCFACGTGRAEGDGLRIFPGRVADDADARVRVAATWTPDPSVGDDDDDGVSLPATWAALDCIGGWAGDLGERLMVLGSMTAHVHDLPRVGEEHVLVGSDRGTKGRRTFTAATLYAADSRVLGVAEHIWIAVDPEDFS